jgi:hypothetical protein
VQHLRGGRDAAGLYHGTEDFDLAVADGHGASISKMDA